MDSGQLRALQAPLKDQYRERPETAQVTLTASGTLDGDGILCRVETGQQLAEAGLHPATGGDGTALCSGDMLLESLVACAGVTLRAVSTALDIPVQGGTVTAAGDLDFRGTLAVERDTPIGFQQVRLQFTIETAADEDQLATLIKLTDRYCVVLQTLKQSPELAVECLVKGTAE